MIKVSWEKLNEKPVFTALQQLYGTRGIKGSAAVKIAGIVRQSEKAMQEAREFELELRKKYCCITPDGQFQKNGEEYVFNSPTASSEMAKEMDEKLKSTFAEINVSKIPFAAIKNIGLAPIQLQGIEDFLDGVPSYDAPDEDEAPQGPSGLLLPPHMRS